MKKLILIAAMSASAIATPARAGLNSGDWAAILGAVVEVAGAAATGYAAAQAARQPAQPPEVNVFYTGWSIDPAVGLLCHYSDGSQRPYPSLSECPASFFAPN